MITTGFNNAATTVRRRFKVCGRQLVIADTLSKACLEVPETQVRSLNVDALSEDPDKVIQEVSQAMRTDESMKKFLELIKNRWPNSKVNVPYEVTPYFDVRDTLTHERGMILEGQRIVIPKALRPEMKWRLHAAHMAYDNMMSSARRNFLAENASEIKQLVEGCDICQFAKPKQQKELLTAHNDGNRP